jgi:hypothetical protein
MNLCRARRSRARPGGLRCYATLWLLYVERLARSLGNCSRSLLAYGNQHSMTLEIWAGPVAADVIQFCQPRHGSEFAVPVVLILMKFSIHPSEQFSLAYDSSSHKSSGLCWTWNKQFGEYNAQGHADWKRKKTRYPT